MSNLKDILDEIDAALDHFPDSEKYKKSKMRVVNAQYLDISAAHPWLFLQRRLGLQLYADVSGSATVTVGGTVGEHLVTGSGTTFAAHYEGQTMVLPDGQRSRVARVGSPTSLYIEDRLTSSYVAAPGWSVEFATVPLPVDCAEPLGIMDRAGERGRFAYVSAREEEGLELYRTSTGDPTIYIEDEQLNDRAPEGDLTVVPLAPGGGLAAGVEYEYCYTINAYGRESPPSLVARTKTQGLARTIVISGIEDLRDSTGVNTGRNKSLYRRSVKPSSRWLKIATVPEALTTYTDDGTVPVSREEGNVLYDQDRRQYIRPWYTPSTDSSVELRYLQRPRRLQSDQDVPVWPSAFHRLLVHAALEDIFSQHGMVADAARADVRAKEMLGRMKRKHLTRTDKVYRKKGFDRTTGGERWADPIKLDA